MVWGGNTSIPCRGFGGDLVKMIKMIILAKSGQNLCMGWGFGWFWPKWSFWPKLAACLTWI